MNGIVDASLAEETRRRYLSYALSVITARALPDVRDGLKPVQRRILYTMENDLRLRPDARFTKCAKVVGDVMGKYHPHGDNAIYDALARMAQVFTMRVQLVAGRGNFGSPDGDPPAAMRYTECRLAPLSMELVRELPKNTVDFRPTYDGQLFEPIVLPARFPNMLVNGSQGIAVGMATSIPPHNLGEVLEASIALIDDPKLSISGVMKHIRGPDFPSGGQIVSSKRELVAVYEAGHGSFKLRGEWRTEAAKGRGNPTIILKSIPYGIERGNIVGKIADVIHARKLPALLDVRDESTDDTRIVLEMKKGAEPEMVMAYLYKHTPLQTNVTVNLTCLVPTEQPDVAAPQRVSLLEALQHFLAYRMEVVTRRLRYDLEQLEKRIHILEGFEILFDALDAAIRLIRNSEGRADASAKLQKRFGLSELQADAILDLRLYRLAKLSILELRKELKEKRAEAKRLRALLKSEKARWKLIKAELRELHADFAERRQTKISGATKEPEYDADDFIVDEDAVCLLTQQGWVKRQGRVSDLSATRVRDGDEVQDAVAGSTRTSVALFSSRGSCYVCRLVDIPATTGYGNPVQTLFKLADGERIVRMMGFDPRVLEVPEPSADTEPEPPYAVAFTKGGMTTRFSLRGHREPSTRSGRKFMRLNAGDEVLEVDLSPGETKVAVAASKSHVLVTTDDEIPVLAGAGKGVRMIKLGKDEQVVGARVLFDATTPLIVENARGKPFEITVYRSPVARGGRGTQLFKRGRLVRAVPNAPYVPELE